MWLTFTPSSRNYSKRGTMKRFLLAFLALLLIASGAKAQGTLYNSDVRSTRGPVVPGATITVCTSAATGIPCTPTAPIFSNSTLVTPIPNSQLIADGNGNFQFYAAAGSYILTVTGQGLPGRSFPIVLACVPNSPSPCGSGGGSPAAPQFVYQINNPLNTFGPGILTQDAAGTTVSNAGALLNRGPAPAVDVTAFGARAVLNGVGPSGTATCTAGAGPVTCTLNANYTGVVGDGVVIYGAGATNSMSTPSAPTVTTVVQSGPDANFDVVAGVAGSTTYQYEIAAIDNAGGITAVSSATQITTGQATLGAITTNVSTLARANNTDTLVSSAANLAASGGAIYVQNSTDATFDGLKVVNSITNGTTLTYLDGNDTRAGASTSATGGTITTYQGNKVVWTAVTGAYQYLIYCNRNGGGFALCGISRPGELQWVDYGATYSAVQALPSYVSTSTPPSSATNDYLATTITAIGSSAFTVAGSVGNSVSGATFKFDDGPTLVNAYNAVSSGTTQIGALRFPATSSPFNTYPINSHTILPNTASALTVLQNAPITLNETLEVKSTVNWSGEQGGSGGICSQFSPNCGQQILVKTAYPGINAVPGSVYKFINLSYPANGIGMTVSVISNTFGFEIDNSTFQSGSVDYLGTAVVLFGVARAKFNTDFILVGSGTPNTYGYSIAAGILNKNDVAGAHAPGQADFHTVFMENRGFGISSVPALNNSSTYRFEFMYSQADKTPLVMFGLIGGAGSIFEFDRFLNDTSASNLFMNYNGSAIVTIRNILDNGVEPGAGSPGLVTGKPVTSLIAENTGTFIGQNVNVVRLRGSPQTMTVPVYGSTGKGDKSFSSAVHFPSQDYLYWDLPTPAAPTVTGPSAGGSVPVGTWNYKVTANDAFGGETVLSSASAASCVTTTGNQICTATATALQGAASYNFYRSNGGGYQGVSACQGLTVLACVDNAASGGGHALPTDTAAGLTGISNLGVLTPQVQIVAPVGANISNTATINAASLTANRTINIPDSSGTIVLAGGLDPWIDVSAANVGVVGNGVADDTAAMNTALSLCPTSGCTIFIPAGFNVLVSACLQIPTNKIIHIYAASKGGNGNSEGSEAGFSTKTANCIWQVGNINNGSASWFGARFSNLFFRDTSASNNTALGGVFISDTNNSICDNCSFEDFNRPSVSAPPAPTIAAAGTGTNWFVETTCVNNVGGETVHSAESTLVNAGATLTVTGLTAGNCPSPSTGYRVWASTSASGAETIQSGSSCTLNAAGTGCGLGNNWVGAVSAGSLTLKAVQYDTSSGFGWLQSANSGASGTFQDSSYGHIINPQCRNTQECFILDGGLTTVTGGHLTAPVNYGYLVNNYQAAQLLLNGGGMEVANTTTTRGIIVNSQSSSVIEGFKFEGVTNGNTNVTCAEVNTSRNMFLGDTWIKCGKALIQENAGIGNNTYDIQLQVINLASPLITGLTANDIVYGNTSNGGIGTQIPTLILGQTTGVTQCLQANSGGVVQGTGSACPNGITPRALTGATSTDTVLAADNFSIVEHDQAASASVTETLPTPTTLGNATFNFTYSNHSGSVDTLSPAGGWSVIRNTAASASTAVMRPEEFCRATIDPFHATTWDLDCTHFKFKGTIALGTSAIASGTCTSAFTLAAPGVQTTDVVTASFNVDPTATTGWAANTNGSLFLYGYPTSAQANVKVCNNTASSITPGANLTINVAVQ